MGNTKNTKQGVRPFECVLVVWMSYDGVFLRSVTVQREWVRKMRKSSGLKRDISLHGMWLTQGSYYCTEVTEGKILTRFGKRKVGPDIREIECYHKLMKKTSARHNKM